MPFYVPALAPCKPLNPSPAAHHGQCEEGRYDQKAHHDQRLRAVPAESQPGVLEQENHVLEWGGVPDLHHSCGQHFKWWPTTSDQQHHKPQEHASALCGTSCGQDQAEE